MVVDRSMGGWWGLGRLALAGLVLAPYLAWGLAGDPSLFDDDLIRAGSLRRSTVAASLFRPFNEHVAPLFEFIGWGAWWASGEEVSRVTSAFRATALASATLMVLALGVLVRLELGSAALGWLAAGLLAWQTATSEVVLWYSASSFGWAAAATLGALIAAHHAATAPTQRGRRIGLIGTVFLALAGPLFSAIGVLAGPLAALRLAVGPGQPDGPDRPARPGWLAAGVPLLGTLVFALIVASGPGRSAVAGSVRERIEPIAAAWAGLQAPVLVLAPALLGFDSWVGRVPDWVAALGTAALGGVAWRLTRRRPERGTLVLALAWVAGGYGLTYAPRARAGDAWIFAVGRYHLFPMIGAILALVTILSLLPTPPWPTPRWARRVAIGLGAVAVVAVGVGQFGPRWESASVAYRFPEQRAALRAVLRLEGACQAEGVPLAQAIRIVPPTLPRWSPRPAGFHPLLYLFGTDGPNAHRPDDEAKARVLSWLTTDDRSALFQALDARRSGAFASGSPGPGERDFLFLSPGDGAEPTPEGGMIFWREFDLRAVGGEVRALGLRQGSARRQEVWWLGADGRWAAGRSVVWERAADQDWANLWLDLGRLPHWRGDWGHRIRLVRRDRPWPVHPDFQVPSFLEVRIAGADPNLDPSRILGPPSGR